MKSVPKIGSPVVPSRSSRGAADVARRSVLALLCSTALAALAASTPISAPPELLDAEAAFVPTAERKDASTVVVRYQIAPQYYMYRARFRAADLSGGDVVKLPMKLPPGKVTDDATFGRVETYRQQIEFPLRLAAHSDKPQRIEIVSQGCAEAGVCYPPLTHRFELPAGKGVVAGVPVDRASASSASRPAAVSPPSRSNTSGGSPSVLEVISAPPRRP